MISESALIVFPKILEEKLKKVAQKFETKSKEQRIFRRVEYEGFLKNECFLGDEEVQLVKYFLGHLGFARKMKREKEIYFALGNDAGNQKDDFDLNLKVMKQGRVKLGLQKLKFEEEMRELRDKIKEAPEKQNVTLLKINCEANRKSIKQVEQKIQFIDKKIEQSKSVQTEEEMMNVMKETRIDPSILEEAVESLQEGVAIEKEVDKTRAVLDQLIEKETKFEADDDLLAIISEEKEVR